MTTTYCGSSRFTVSSIRSEGPDDAMDAGTRLVLEAGRALDRCRREMTKDGVNLADVPREAVAIIITYEVTM